MDKHVADNGAAVSPVPEYSSSSAEDVTRILTTQDGRPGVNRITDNPFFTAGLGLAVLGAGLAGLRKGVTQAAALIKRRLLVDVEINVKDESYPWFLQWMTTHQRGQLPSAAQDGTASTGKRASLIPRGCKQWQPSLHQLSIKTDKIEHPNGSVQTKFSLVPGPGRHLLRYNNVFLLVQRTRETKSIDLAHGRPWETINLTTLYSNRHVIENIFKEAYQLARQTTEGKIVIYTSRGITWEPFGDPRRKRPMDSVVLDKGVKEQILEDVRDFIQSAKWYYDRGIPYRRGYLLHGPPGSGKSSFIQALAAELDYSIAMLNLSERGLTDDRLQHLLSILPPRTLVLLEDADSAFTNRRTQSDADGYRGANVTFSGLLNALDGVASAEERLLFLTTNHAERLDGALIRPGRVDLVVRFGEATRWQAGKLWDRFYGDLDHEGKSRDQFLDRLKDLGIIDARGREVSKGTSAAALQGLFLFNKGNMAGAIDMASRLVPQQGQGQDEQATSKPFQAVSRS